VDIADVIPEPLQNFLFASPPLPRAVNPTNGVGPEPTGGIEVLHTKCTPGARRLHMRGVP
jgi:hypothetical protein